MLPVKYAKYGTEPYSGVLKMWIEVEDKPTGTCRMKVTNPRNGKKYSVPFVVFEGDRLPILSYRTSLQMKLITVEKGNFDMVAGVATESYPDVFDGELGEHPGMEEPWPRGRMPDSGAREPGFESSTYDGAVDGDTLWRQQNKILVIVLGNKL